MSLELTEKTKKYIAKTGYSPVYGARPLKRALQKMILDDLSMQILKGNFTDGDRILVDVTKNGDINFKKISK
jgi:ATP-dependent Clp protease ATP-binding subunit ClpB